MDCSVSDSDIMDTKSSSSGSCEGDEGRSVGSVRGLSESSDLTDSSSVDGSSNNSPAPPRVSEESQDPAPSVSPTTIPLSPQSPDVDITSPENVILDVECGLNKAVLYLNKLSSGSKGSCILFDNAWLTPNEFQYISGRETAKDWKRSIKHYGKSLKLLIAKGVMTSEPASCMCEGCVVPDDGSPQDSADPTHKANLENVPPKEKTEGHQPQSPEVDSPDKVPPEVTDSHVTAADSKVEGGERIVLHNRTGLGADLSDLTADVSKKTAKKRKSQSKLGEKAKKQHKRSQTVKANSAETAMLEAGASDSNGDLDQSCVPTSLDTGAQRPEARPLATDSPTPPLEGVTAAVNGTPTEASHVTPSLRVAPKVNETLQVTEMAERGHCNKDTPNGSPQSALSDSSGDDEEEEEESTDDIKVQSQIITQASGNTNTSHSPIPSSNRATTPILTCVSSTTLPHYPRHRTDNSPTPVIPTPPRASTASDIASSAPELGATLMTPKSEDRLLTSVALQILGDNAPQKESLPLSREQTSREPSSPYKKTNSPMPEFGEDGGQEDETVDSSDDEDGAVYEVTNLEDSPMLSPRKEARLTNIIAELKSYKKQLIQRIEEQKDVTGDMDEDDIEIKSVDERTSANVSPTSDGLQAGADTLIDNKWHAENGCGRSEVREEAEEADQTDLKTSESEVPLEPSQKCRTLFHILSSGSIPETFKDKVDKMESLVVPETSEDQSQPKQKLPDSQPLKSSFEKTKSVRERLDGKRSPKDNAPSPESKDLSAVAAAISRKEPTATSTSTSAPSRVGHSVTSLISPPTTVTSAVSPLAANSMYLAPPMFPFPFGIPPPFMYPGGLYSGYPFPPADPATLYKSMSVSTPIPTAATSASTLSSSSPSSASSSSSSQQQHSSHHKVSRSSPAASRHSTSPSVRHENKPSSKPHKREHSPHRTHNNNNISATNNNSTSSSKLLKSLPSSSMLSPNLITGHYLPMFSPFGLPDMTHLSATSAAVAPSSSVSPRSSAPERSAGSSSVNGKSFPREKRDKYYEYDSAGALDLSVKKRAAPASFDHLNRDHHHNHTNHHAKRPCFDMGFTYRNGVVLDLSRSAR